MTNQEFERAVEAGDLATIAGEARRLQSVLAAIAKQKCTYASLAGGTETCEPGWRRACGPCQAREALAASPEPRPVPSNESPTARRTPCHDQTPEKIEEWLRANVENGAEVAIRSTQGGLLRYEIATVSYIGKGRFAVGSAGTFYYSGRNCFHPKGQTSLVIPTPGVRSHASQFPHGEAFAGWSAPVLYAPPGRSSRGRTRPRRR